jgi:hypothetical protein
MVSGAGASSTGQAVAALKLSCFSGQQRSYKCGTILTQYFETVLGKAGNDRADYLVGSEYIKVKRSKLA